jgi:hypothetical protein
MKISCCLFFILLNHVFLFSQELMILEYNSVKLIADAIIVQNGRHIGTTNEQGICIMKDIDRKSKVCIKTFGFLDTCFFVNGEKQKVYLKPRAFETDEVQIIGSRTNKKDRFLSLILNSISLCHQKSLIRFYTFNSEVRPDSTPYFDRMEGRFYYKHPSIKSSMHYHDLYGCDLRNIVSGELADDTLKRYNMDKGSLPIVMMNLYHLSIPYYKSYKKRMKESHLESQSNDSTFVFTYIDSTHHPSKEIWTFTKEGRLIRYESIRKMAESKRTFGRSRGTKYTSIEYTTNGTLEPLLINIYQEFTNNSSQEYSYSVRLIKDSKNCTEGKSVIPVGLGIAAWAKRNHIDTMIAAE